MDTTETGMPTVATARTELPPGPKGHFLVGNLASLGGDRLVRLEEWAREFGDIFSFRAFSHHSSTGTRHWRGHREALSIAS